ncbi:iron-containing alcohol dehydrogenase [Bacillus salipaludis]|uniref:iron-containing alcohol dehydrogenase n=1 Tax=Bacillus salipaludis TaxID=2547811 RepID=UPI003D1983C0
MNIASFQVAKKIVTGIESIVNLSEELVRLNCTHPLIVTDTQLVKLGIENRLREYLKEIPYQIVDQMAAEPSIAMAKDCVEIFQNGKFDGVIAVGGGSVIDIAKIVSVLSGYQGKIEELIGRDKVPKREVPLIVVPTTAGTGSEVTNVCILNDEANQRKVSIVSDQLLPDVAIISPELTISMPASVTAACGMDALVHAIEAYNSVRASPITDALALQAIKLIVRYLPEAYQNPETLEAREAMANASIMAGMAFGNAGVGPVHALAYPINSGFKLSHGMSNAILLPYVMEWNQLSCLVRFRDIAEAIGIQFSKNEAATQLINRIKELCQQVGIPAKLSDAGIPEQRIPAMVEEALNYQHLLNNNPRKLQYNDIEDIYRAAY